MKTVPFTPTGCILHKSHRPKPSRLQKHHRFPLHLQKRVVTVDLAAAKALDIMCADGHSDVHVMINALLVGGPRPRGIGAAEAAAARRAIKLFRDAGGTVPL